MEKKLCKCGCELEVTNIKNTYIVGHSNRSPEVKLKKAQMFLKKYGVDNPSKLKEIKEKNMRNTSFRWNVKERIRSNKNRKA